MAYIANNLALMFSPVSASMPRTFIYYNADADSDATIVGAGFFSDGVDKGLRKGDLVDVINIGTPKYKRYQGLSVSGSATTVQAPTAIT
jgi:hypothetical protein